jgi:hypothetical protein
MGQDRIFIPFLEAEERESCGVPNIELMMQLIHSRKALETDPIATCRNYRIPITLEEFYH